MYDIDMGGRWRTLSLYDIDIDMGRRWRTLSLYDHRHGETVDDPIVV